MPPPRPRRAELSPRGNRRRYCRPATLADESNVSSVPYLFCAGVGRPEFVGNAVVSSSRRRVLRSSTGSPLGGPAVVSFRKGKVNRHVDKTIVIEGRYPPDDSLRLRRKSLPGFVMERPRATGILPAVPIAPAGSLRSQGRRLEARATGPVEHPGHPLCNRVATTKLEDKDLNPGPLSACSAALPRARLWPGARRALAANWRVSDKPPILPERAHLTCCNSPARRRDSMCSEGKGERGGMEKTE